MHRFTSVILAFALFLVPLLAAGYPTPVARQRVYDLAGYMPDSARRAALNQELLRFEADHAGIQIAVLTVNSTEGETLEGYGLGVLRSWGIGQAGQNSGLLLLIVRHGDDGRSKTRIEVGYGLEGTLPNALCSRIINEVMRPLARDQRNPQGAIEAGAREFMHRLGGDEFGRGPMGGPVVAMTLASHEDPNEAEAKLLLFYVFTVILIIAVIIAFLQRRSSSSSSYSWWDWSSTSGSGVDASSGGSDFGGGDGGGSGASGGFD